MAEKKATNEKTSYIVKVKNNKEFCGIGAGGTQFANGEATVTNVRLARWFKEHPGYDVEEVK